MDLLEILFLIIFNKLISFKILMSQILGLKFLKPKYYENSLINLNENEKLSKDLEIKVWH
jgi:hypothetical protein